MTDRQQPHPQRCETCKNVDCDLHEQGKGNRNPETGYEWDHYHWYHAIINEKGCASHSSETEPERCKQPKEICDECDLDWLECGIDVEVCEQEKHDAAVAQAVREEVLDDITKYVVKHTRDDKALRLEVVTRYPLIEFLKSLRSGGK